ncbi:DUF1697 domain-containing protein [Lapidilactobacillus wuchangensis]|uniref:DUF1697 domain-containing protein n=1 Tax=Lapidilactobacillus wuchangensis TaxID=2486001 RepID=UPI000F7A145D|nr:DUF1697 domain-containing protein [Lapidilactobacillus wuchangensis]
MKTYLALLRGVNVGGKNRVVMATLKAAFEQHGFTNVRTYLNSGNVVFTTEETPLTELTNACTEIIAAVFDLMITVTVISGADLLAALMKRPAWWQVDSAAKHNAIFVIAPTTTAEVIESVGAAKPEYEQVAAVDQLIFWSAPLKTFSRTRWSKVVGSKYYDRITIRNANTVLKLAALIAQTNDLLC